MTDAAQTLSRLTTQGRLEEADALYRQVAATGPVDMGLLLARMRYWPQDTDAFLAFADLCMARDLKPHATMALDHVLRVAPEDATALDLLERLVGAEEARLTAGHRPETVLLASPETSGDSWLINCLLELGVRTGPVPNEYYLRHQHLDDGSTSIFRNINTNTDAFRCTPTLTFQHWFVFREDLFVHETKHRELAADYVAGKRAILFVRDFVDALYSNWHRIGTGSFLDWAREHAPNVRRFVAAHLDIPELLVLRFEDYKRAPRETLRRACDFLGLTVDEDQLASAVYRSDYQRARLGEKVFLTLKPDVAEQTRLTMRGGKTSQLTADGPEAEAVALIRETLADTETRLREREQAADGV